MGVGALIVDIDVIANSSGLLQSRERRILLAQHWRNSKPRSTGTPGLCLLGGDFREAFLFSSA